MALRVTNLTTGALVADRVGVAATRSARAVGLLNRDALEPGEGLWIVPSRGVHTCWMRFAIDVVALDEDGVVIDRVDNLKPWRLRLPRRGTAGVLELAAGTVGQSGTEVGHRLELETAASRARPLRPAAVHGAAISHDLEEIR